MRMAYILASPPDRHEVPGGMLSRLRRHRGAFLAEAARILAIPAPVGLLARLESGIRGTLPAACATKPPSKPPAAPAMSTPPTWTTPPRATQAPPKQAAPIDSRMKRAEFDRLNPEARGQYLKAGGLLKD